MKNRAVAAASERPICDLAELVPRCRSLEWCSAVIEQCREAEWNYSARRV